MDIVASKACNSKNRTKGRNGLDVRWIVVHNTGADGSAQNNLDYFANTAGTNASAHLFVDDTGVYQSVAFEDTAWAVGNLDANRRSISVEVCSDCAAFTDAEVEHLGRAVRELMATYGVDADHVVRHRDMHDAAVAEGCGTGKWVDPGKACPAWYCDDARWEALKARVLGGGTGAATEAGGASDGAAEAASGFEGGTYRVNVGALNVRSAPGLSGSVVATYRRGQTVVLDSWYTVADGYVWARYTGGSGKVRYVAVGKATGKPESDDYLVTAS